MRGHSWCARGSAGALTLIVALGGCGGVGRTPDPKQEMARVGRIADPGTGARQGGAERPDAQAHGPASQAVPSVRLADAGAPPAGRAAPLVVFLGDSLSAGLGLDVDEAYPTLVGRALAERGLPVRVVNAGLSGDTSAGGRERLAWFLRQKPDLVVVELGANDALRGQPLDGVEANLRDILERIAASGARAVLAGMRIPTNYGPDYTRGFEEIFPRLAAETGATLIPFLLDGVGGRPELNQADGIHPTATGQRIVARTVTEALTPLVRELYQEPAASGSAP